MLYLVKCKILRAEKHKSCAQEQDIQLLPEPAVKALAHKRLVARYILLFFSSLVLCPPCHSRVLAHKAIIRMPKALKEEYVPDSWKIWRERRQAQQELAVTIMSINVPVELV
jgi:hypothetical protein